MIDLVYPLGDSGWNHNELRYSLRSVERYAAGQVRRVIIAGNCPSWLRGVLHIPVEVGGGTVPGQLRAFREVLKLRSLSDVFVYMNDDIILQGAPQWFDQRYLPGGVTGGKVFQGHFHRAVEFLTTIGVGPVLNYELHIPMAMTPEGMRDTMARLPHHQIAFRTVYGNLYPDPEPEPMADVKLRGGTLPDPSWWCFSIDDTSPQNETFRAWMAERYPEPSRWEVG